MAAKAYHGTPHDFEQFKLAHIGTGEGAQSYGWGLYFAGDKDVAEWYKNKLAVEDPHVNGELLDPHNPLHYLANILNQESGNEKETREFLEQMVISGSKVVKKIAGEALKLFDAGQRPEVDFVKPKGRLYHVVLQPDDDEYLLWDEPLSKQSDKVRNILEPKFDKDVGPLGRLNSSGKKIGNGHSIYDLVQNYYVGEKPNTAKAASEYLHSLGIKGIKYLDGSSRTKGEGNYNYVIFDEDDVTLEIKE